MACCSLSVLDGWWVEGRIEGVTGWAIGAEGDAPETHGKALYDKLEGTVLPLFHHDPHRLGARDEGCNRQGGCGLHLAPHDAPLCCRGLFELRGVASLPIAPSVRRHFSLHFDLRAAYQEKDHATDTPAGARRNPGPDRGECDMRRMATLPPATLSLAKTCNACHVVEAKQKKPRRIVIGPAFRDIANTRGMTATALRVFLTTSHPKMPNLILTPEQTADVISYILSLRHRPRS